MRSSTGIDKTIRVLDRASQLSNNRSPLPLSVGRSETYGSTTALIPPSSSRSVLSDRFLEQCLVPGNLFRLMKPDAKKRLISNIVGSLGNAPKRIQEKQLGHFLKADPAYGRGVAEGLGIYPFAEMRASLQIITVHCDNLTIPLQQLDCRIGTNTPTFAASPDSPHISRQCRYIGSE